MTDSYFSVLFFVLLASILVANDHASKTHVLLTNTLYYAHGSYQNWTIYSDWLWSSLIQLNIVFPDNRIGKKSPQYNTELAQRPLDYGVSPSRVTLEGDSSLVMSICKLDIQKKRGGGALKKLSLLSSQLMSSEEEISDFRLDLSNSVLHNIREFPLSLCVTGAKLKSLSLTGCQLESIPFTFGDHFCFLQTLNLSMNVLEDLPKSISKLSNLFSLQLNENKFIRLPEVLGTLSSLRMIGASKNRIDNIDALLTCRNLSTIDVRQTNIKSVPLDLTLKLPKLSLILLNETITDNFH